MEDPFTSNCFAGTATPSGTDSEQKAFEDNKFRTKQIQELVFQPLKVLSRMDKLSI